MAIGNDASKGAELLQQGIRQVREGRNQEAYAVFREAVTYDPGNEFGWIWLSITSPDRTEKRLALQRALQINPNSSHARQAMQALDAETPREVPPPPPENAPFGLESPPPVPLAEPAPLKRGLNARIGNRTSAVTSDDLTANLREEPRSNRGRTATSGALVGTRSAGQRFAGAVRAVLLVLVVLIVLGLAAFFVYTNVINKPTPLAYNGPTPTSAVVPATTVAPLTTSDTASLAPTNVVATALAPTPTPQTALLITVTPPPASVTVSATQASQQVSQLLSDAQNSAGANDYKTAIGDYKQVLNLDPTNVQANLRLGLAYLNAPDNQLENPTSRFDAAIAALRTVTDVAPTWSGGFSQLGAAYAGKGDLLDAIAAYRTSLDLDPNGPERWLALAALYDRNNQAAEAAFARSKAQNLIAATITTTVTITPVLTATTTSATTTLATTTEVATPVPTTLPIVETTRPPAPTARIVATLPPVVNTPAPARPTATPVRTIAATTKKPA